MRIIWVALAGATLAGLLLGRMELRISGPVIVLPTDNTDVRAAVEGIIDRIYVNEGDRVRAGDPIARLSDRDVLTELGKTEAEIREAHYQLTMLEAGPTPQDIDVAKVAVSKAEDQVKYAQTRLARLKAMLDAGVLPRNLFEDNRESAIMTENELVSAKARLTALLSSIRPEQIDAIKAQIERLETNRRYLEEQRGLLRVVSPAAGIVATPSRQLKEMRHVLVKKGDLILKVYDFKALTAQILVSEKEIAEVRVGQDVVIRVRAFPFEEFHGTVNSIGTSAQAGSGVGGETPFGATSSSSSSISANKTILVTTQIDNSSLLLKPEMTGQAKISCGEAQIVDVFKRKLARTFKVEFWSWL